MQSEDDLNPNMRVVKLRQTLFQNRVFCPHKDTSKSLSERINKIESKMEGIVGRHLLCCHNALKKATLTLIDLVFWTPFIYSASLLNKKETANE